MSTAREKEPFDLDRLRDACQLGTLYRGGAVVVIEESVLDEILAYSGRTTAGEVGGFLLGEVFSQETPCTIVRYFHPATQATSRAASLTFTHETWADLHRQAESRFPGAAVVGWQHTHPGFGVFLSAHDLFIHRNFFSEPWQIAMVVDPRREELGFFHWRNGDVHDCGFVCLGP
jgi:proteasome lid subunit RPN8/RPN11